MEESFDQLYGSKGIDTTYEREKITYRPLIHYKKELLPTILRPEVMQSIERARTFTISQNLLEYDELVEDIQSLLSTLESRMNPSLLLELKQLFMEKNYIQLFSFEKANSGHLQTGDYELYSILSFMLESAQARRVFLDNHYRTQFTSETDVTVIQEKEQQAIDEWEQLEANVWMTYQNKAQVSSIEEDHAHGIESSDLHPDEMYLDHRYLEQLEKQKRSRELLHVSLADISYVHRNRYFFFLEALERARILVHRPMSFIDKDLKEFLLRVAELPSYEAPKTHLLLQFKKVKEKHHALKGRQITMDEEKESFGSEKQFLFQQIETKTVEPLKQWLHEQEENQSSSLDKFSQYLVHSMKESHQTYEESLADMLNFYRAEANFYESQMNFLREKEEIRRFYRILEDLEEVELIQAEWVEEYLKANGYTV